MAERPEEKKRALILCDNDSLGKAIQLHLQNRLHVLPPHKEGYNGNGESSEQPELIVVALSSAQSDPVAILIQASLVNQIGRIPLLIISDRPVQIAPTNQITYLGFPFDIDTLYQKVDEILELSVTTEPALPFPFSAQIPTAGPEGNGGKWAR